MLSPKTTSESINSAAKEQELSNTDGSNTWASATKQVTRKKRNERKTVGSKTSMGETNKVSGIDSMVDLIKEKKNLPSLRMTPRASTG
jgi:hypothetical protein